MTDQSLWCAVIQQALTDATEPSVQDQNNDPFLQPKARGWFKRADRDFQEVCGLAGLDADAVREHALEAIAAADRKQAEADITGRRTSRFLTLTFRGETLTLKEWSKRTGLSPAALSYRVRLGWTTDATLTTPPIPRGHKAPPGVVEGSAERFSDRRPPSARDFPDITFLEAAE